MTGRLVFYADAMNRERVAAVRLDPRPKAFLSDTPTAVIADVAAGVRVFHNPSPWR